MPGDPFYDNINPYLKRYLFESWIYKQELEIKKLRSLGLFIGSFSNPEAANNLYKADNPDIESTDSEELANKIHNQIIEEEKINSKRINRRKKKILK